MTSMPVLVQTPSPNYNPVPINHDLIFVHIMEGGCLGSVAFLCQYSTQASVHFCMLEDGSKVYQLVPVSLEAWAQCAFNRKGISLELPGFTAQGIPDARWRAAAKLVAWLCRAYAIPPVWAPNGVGRGVCQHHDLGKPGGGHVDCTDVGSPTWMTFMGYVKEEFDEFGKGPLPVWALHGLPAPHSVELPPNVPPEPSHGGAARNDPTTGFVPHPTASGYPHGSAADLQWRLNKTGATPPLIVDGFAGDKTRAALVAFQTSHNLTPDGVIGPLTWSALDAATA